MGIDNLSPVTQTHKYTASSVAFAAFQLHASPPARGIEIILHIFHVRHEDIIMNHIIHMQILTFFPSQNAIPKEHP